MKKYPVLSWLSKVKASMAIVQETDTATVAISKGKYVLWKNNMCKAKSNISANATLSSSNLTAVSEGGLNSLLTDISSSIDTVNSNISTLSTNVGNLNSLSTSAKNTIVAAINEVDSHADTATTALSGVSTYRSYVLATDTSINSGTPTKLATYTFPKGYYMISYTAAFGSPPSSSYYGNYREAFIADDESAQVPSQMDIASRGIYTPVYGINTRFNVVITLKATASTTLHFYVRHDADSALTCSGRISYFKVPMI